MLRSSLCVLATSSPVSAWNTSTGTGTSSVGLKPVRPQRMDVVGTRPALSWVGCPVETVTSVAVSHEVPFAHQWSPENTTRD